MEWWIFKDASFKKRAGQNFTLGATFSPELLHFASLDIQIKYFLRQ